MTARRLQQRLQRMEEKVRGLTRRALSAAVMTELSELAGTCRPEGEVVADRLSLTILGPSPRRYEYHGAAARQARDLLRRDGAPLIVMVLKNVSLDEL